MTSTSVKVIWADFGSIFTRLTRNLLIFNPCAQDETRTHTALRPLPPQSSVYTNFTTCARRKPLRLWLTSLCSVIAVFALTCFHSQKFRILNFCSWKFSSIWEISPLCPKQDSNLHASRHTHLKRTRLPIPPLGPWEKKQNMGSALFLGAANETRTRDPDLGKVVIYQLSYCRIMCENTCFFCESGCKGTASFLITQIISQKKMHYGRFLG